MDVANELAYILLGIVLDAKIRKNDKFSALKIHAYKALIIANDIFSFAKELKQGDKENYIFIRQNENHCTLQDAVDMSIEQYNKEITDFHLTAEALLDELNSVAKTPVQAAIRIIANQVQAHLEWALQTSRYHGLMTNNLSVDTNHFHQLGTGHVLSVAYDTAWLARVPAFPGLDKPAFPQALDWLREQQLADGSWGAVQPFNAHGNTLSTLAAILALCQWGHPQDQARIARGIKSLHDLAQALARESKQTVGFELLLPALVCECKVYGLRLPEVFEQQYQKYAVMIAKKKQLISTRLQKTGNAGKPVSWWFSLEMLGNNVLTDKDLSIDLDDVKLFPQGSVAASPAATAFLLTVTRRRCGKDLPRAYDYLHRSMLLNQDGGAPNVFPIDEFELTFSANYFLEAGLEPAHPLMVEIIAEIYKKWQLRGEKGLGYSSEFIIDPDDSSVAIAVLAAAGYQDIDPGILLQCFNGVCIENFKGERIPSLSANIHAVKALRMLPVTAKIKSTIDSIVRWLKQQLDQYTVLDDKWHSSPVYPMSRAVIALEGLNDPFAQRCVDWLLEQQHTDGGWGRHGFTTAEETGFASLALSYWRRQGHPVSKSILENAAEYLRQSLAQQQYPLWIGKVLYCPKLVVASVVAAAQISLESVIN